MAQQYITTTPVNSGQGTPINQAFDICNINFTELYARAQSNPPATLIGSAGDEAGMYAYDSTYFYYCYANYDGSSTIWAQVIQSGNVELSSIQNGNSNVVVDSSGNVRVAANGNITMGVANTANVVTVTANSLSVTGNVYDINGQLYGVPASHAKYTRTTTQTGIVANSVVICDVAEATFGSDIAVNTTTGNITLQAGKTYRLRGQVGRALSSGSPAGLGYQWFNVTTNAWAGQPGTVMGTAVNGNDALNMATAEWIVTPSVTTVVQLRITGSANTTTISPQTGIFAYTVGAPFIDIQAIGGQAPIINSAQYGSVVSPVATNTLVGTTVGAATTVLTYVIPSAGTWQIEAVVPANVNGGADAYYQWALFDATGTEVADTRTFGVYQNINATVGQSSNTFTVTTSDSAIYTVRMWGTGTRLVNSTAFGLCTGKYNQIAGLAPTAPLPTAGFAKYTRSTSQNGVTANTVVICNVPEATSGGDIAVNTSTGNITLLPNKTYRLRGGIGLFDTTTSRISYNWYNATANAWIGEPSVAHSTAAGTGVGMYMGSAECVITPSVTTTVQLKVIQVSSTGAIGAYPANNSVDAGLPWIDVEVIGQTVATTGEPNWTAGGTIQAVGISATTTAPTVPTTTQKNQIYYKQIGAKTWQVQGVLHYNSATGAAGGSGDYLFTLPAGLSFDTSIQTQSIYTANVITSSWEPLFAALPGSSATAFNGSSVTYAGAGVVPWSTTQYRIIMPIPGNNVFCWSSGWYQMGGAATGKFNWTFTFQSL